MISLYTYEDMSKIFRVSIKTIYSWKCQGLFKIIGYRRLGKFAKEAVVSEEEVKLLIKRKYVR